jgi:hypothetical protein
MIVTGAMSAMMTFGLTPSAFAGDDPSAPASTPSTESKEVQDLKQQMADQQKQLEEMRQILLGQKKQIDSVAASAAAATPAAPAQPVPTPKTVDGDVTSLSTIVPPLPVAPAPKTALPPAPAPAPAPQASAAAVPDSPLQLKVGGTTITPIGFMDMTNTWRSTADGDSLKTNFGKFPYNNSLPLARDSEDKFSLQNSRVGARFDGAYKDWHYIGYWESDFVGDFAGNNTQVTSNSVLMRLRLYWVDLRNKHFEVLGGQSWSLLTPNRNGLSALPGDLFYGQEFDVNYLNGLTWGRIPGIRFIYHSNGDKINFGVSLENADQYFGGSGGASSPTLPAASQFASDYGNQLDASQTNDVSIPQLRPDIIAKLAIQPNSRVHVEVAGLSSQFKVFNTANSTYYTTTGEGGSINANFGITPKIHLVTNNFWSDGEGRYLFGEVPDVIARANGSLSAIHAGSTVDGIEAQVGKFQFYSYYGGIASGKNIALDANGTTPIGWGFKGSSNAQNKAIQEFTIGWVHTLWRDSKFGALQEMVQYAYFTRSPFSVAANTPKNAHQDAIWFDLRYVLPGSAPSVTY